MLSLGRGDKSYNEYLDDNRSVYLPPEIVAGECLLILHGSYQNIIAVTDSLKLTINENDLVSNAESTEISTSLYSQLVTKMGNGTLKTESQTIIGAINELYDILQTS